MTRDDIVRRITREAVEHRKRFPSTGIKDAVSFARKKVLSQGTNAAVYYGKNPG